MIFSIKPSEKVYINVYLELERGIRIRDRLYNGK